MAITLTNVQIVTEDETLRGTLIYGAGGVVEVQPGNSAAPGAEDCEGDFIAPGLIECHTDNIERHFAPRPGVVWPNPLASALAHDAQIVGAGITTVYNAVCVGGYDDGKDFRTKIMTSMIEAIDDARRKSLLRADHRLHLRCETTDPKMMGYLTQSGTADAVKLASLMDHTPGQRQWRDLDNYRKFIKGEGRTEDEIEEIIKAEIDRASQPVHENFQKAVAFFKQRDIPMASHDDTTVEHVADAHAAGCMIAEFPTTVEAAQAAREKGMKIVAGAPNVVRGGSHSGGVAVTELAKWKLVDVLSSDYVPASLLQAVHALSKSTMTLHEAAGLATWRAADMLGLADRGRLTPGQRADFVRFRVIDGTPIVRAVTVGGQRVF